MNKQKEKGKLENWTPEEDAILVETILEHLRKKKTQKEAYEVASKKINRTTAACGYRWKVIRKGYEEEIKKAKSEDKPNHTQQSHVGEIKPKLEFSEIVSYLKELHDKAFGHHEEILRGYQTKIRALEHELMKVQEENKHLRAIVGTIRAAVQHSEDE